MTTMQFALLTIGICLITPSLFLAIQTVRTRRSRATLAAGAPAVVPQRAQRPPLDPIRPLRETHTQAPAVSHPEGLIWNVRWWFND